MPPRRRGIHRGWDQHFLLPRQIAGQCRDTDQASAALVLDLKRAAAVKAGLTYGETDDFSYNIARDPVHIHDLNATVLHCLGIDHTRLTYEFQGRHHRLTDAHGRVVEGILA